MATASRPHRTSPPVRISFPALFQPRSYQGGAPRFSVKVMFDKSDAEHKKFLNQLAEDYEYVGLSLDTARSEESPSGLWRSNLAAYGDMEEPDTLENGDVIYKLITPSHFYVASIQPDEGRFRGLVFGTWEIREGQYVEKVEVATWNQEMVGAEAIYDYMVSEEKFEMEGMIISNEDSTRIAEYYTRLE